MIGIDDVARAAGVSNATVSRALSGRGSVSVRAQQRVLAAAQELGYVVSSTASGLASGRSQAIGVIVPTLNRWFYASIVQSAQDALIGAGYDLTLYNLGGGADRRGSVFEQFLRRRRVDGFIAISLEVTAEEVRTLHALNKPIVCVGGPIPGVHTLGVDDVAMAMLVTDHLLELGHRRIAYIGGGPGEKDFHMPAKRKAGYERSLSAAGLPVDRSLMDTGVFTVDSGYAAACRLLQDPVRRPTAIFAASDEMAVGAMLAARDLGLAVPDDLSIAGIDDYELAPFFGLTTVAQDPADQGTRAVELLLQELRRDDGLEGGEGNTAHPFELILRTSTAPPPA